VEIDGADGREVAILGGVGPLAIVQPVDQLGHDEVQIRVPLAVGMRRHVDGDTVDRQRQIAPVVDVDPPDGVLARLALAAVLHGD
jgi:hypothetical protein